MSALFHIRYSEHEISPEIIKAIDSLQVEDNSYAALDMDNTLLIGDIGEAVFALLVKKKLIKNFGWKDYQSLIEKNKLKAYKHIINIMQGLPVRSLEEATMEVIGTKNKNISVEGFKIPVPKPNQLMKKIAEILEKKGIAIYVVTASNEVSARMVCKKYFGIPYSNIIGAEVAVDSKGIIQRGTKEFPYGKGKVNILKKRFRHKPIVTGGDSPGDKYLLNHTVKVGIRLWLGQ